MIINYAYKIHLGIRNEMNCATRSSLAINTNIFSNTVSSNLSHQKYQSTGHIYIYTNAFCIQNNVISIITSYFRYRVNVPMRYVVYCGTPEAAMVNFLLDGQSSWGCHQPHRLVIISNYCLRKLLVSANQLISNNQ